MISKTAPSFQWESLLMWYKNNGRHHLPWRQYDPIQEIQDTKSGVGTLGSTSLESGIYKIWLSEILLQQTQVDRVIPYLEKILEKYPTIHHLAQASYEEFFPYYQGMGYYSRARNILKTAKIVSKEYGGIFPRDKKVLQKLPGVGGYTSSAILAFGYGDPYLAWDTNLEKVFARYYNGRKDIKLKKEEKERIEGEFDEFLQMTDYEGRIANTRAINNALMDFAATADLKNPDTIEWDNYPIQSGLFYETRGSLEPREEKKSRSFPIPDATVVVILHQDHHDYYIPQYSDEYIPFILTPALHRDIRLYVQEYFRKIYLLELSIRPIHAKWLSPDGRAYIAVNAQIQAGDRQQFQKTDKKTAHEVLKKMIP